MFIDTSTVGAEFWTHELDRDCERARFRVCERAIFEPLSKGHWGDPEEFSNFEFLHLRPVLWYIVKIRMARKLLSICIFTIFGCLFRKFWWVKKCFKMTQSRKNMHLQLGKFRA